jgi:hypothetical protein
MSEDDQEKSWECTTVLKYCEETGMDISTNHECLVELKSQSWVNFFALSLNNLTPIIKFVRNQNLLNRVSFCHLIEYCKTKPLIQYCKTKTPIEIARIHKASSSPTGIKYKFGIQVPKGIKNAINLDKKNGNHLWEGAIKTELKQLTDYETLIVLDSGEDLSKGYQNIAYHIVFDVKYDLRHKARLVVGGNWTVNDKEDIYLGVVQMVTVRIGFFLEESYGLSCCINMAPREGHSKAVKRILVT